MGESYNEYAIRKRRERNLFYLEPDKMTLKELKAAMEECSRHHERFIGLAELFREKADACSLELQGRIIKLVQN